MIQTNIGMQVGNIIDALSQKLKIPVHQLFQMLLKQANIQAHFDKIYIASAFICLALIIPCGIVGCSRWASRNDLEPLFIIPAVVFGVSFIALTAGTLAQFWPELVTIHTNPQYWAFMQIFHGAS